MSDIKCVSDIRYTVKKTDSPITRVNVTVDGRVIVLCPKNVSAKRVRELIASHAEHIKETLVRRRTEAREKLFSDPSSPSLPYFGERYPLVYLPGDTFRFENGKFFCGLDIADRITEHYREFLREETRAYVIPRCAELAEIHRFRYHDLRIKAVHSRFGSCSTRGNLNFSLALAMYDTVFIDFVILHELCHTVHHNHGKGFYSLLGSVCPEHASILLKYKKVYGTLMRIVCGNPDDPFAPEE